MASVSSEGRVTGKIGEGILILLGITHSDSSSDALTLAEKCVNLRIFDDESGKMNLSLTDVKGDALVVSQFTLYGDTRKGRRPNFMEAAAPETAIPLYEQFIREIRRLGVVVESGVFGGMMDVELVNRGPVTIMLDTEKKKDVRELHG